jgi:polyphosphate kinase 2 (PPK2 family)
MADRRPEKRIAELIGPLRVKPGAKVNLAKDFDPGYKAGYVKKKDALGIMQRGIDMLCDYQARLAAQDSYGVLVCLQALDAAGKDGTIRHVMSGVNPQGVHVTSFKTPSAEELDHDYLWRYARHLPARGDIGIFNRSHYEEVLVVRVHPEILDRQKLPEDAKGKGVWQRRYREINDWERYLTENGFRIVKMFLNLTKKSSPQPSNGTTVLADGEMAQPARRCDHHPRQRDTGAGQGGRDHEAAAVNRDAGIDVGDQLGQDRDAHAEPDDRGPADGHRPQVRGRGRRLRDGRADHPRGGPAGDSAR